MKYIDLHTHSTCSDGTDSPASLVRLAAKAGLAAVALTDHDTISGLHEAEQAGREHGIEVVRGCELSVGTEQGEVHILGLFLPQDPTSLEELENALQYLRDHRSRRNAQIVQKLQEMGLEIDYEAVLNRLGDRAGGESVGRPHIAKLLQEKGYVSSIREAFSVYLGNKGKAFVPKKVLKVSEAMGLLQRSKATICLAHPGLMACSHKWLDSFVAKLKEQGLHAIEAYHSEHAPAAENMCKTLAKKYELAITGGSDYHGNSKPQIVLGFGKGNLRIPEGILDTLRNA